MQAVGAKAYLVNTGWNGTGKRISLKDTRAIIDAILDGSIDSAPSVELPIFGLDMPCLLYTSPSPRDLSTSRMPSSA